MSTGMIFIVFKINFLNILNLEGQILIIWRNFSSLHIFAEKTKIGFYTSRRGRNTGCRAGTSAHQLVQSTMNHPMNCIFWLNENWIKYDAAGGEAEFELGTQQYCGP